MKTQLKGRIALICADPHCTRSLTEFLERERFAVQPFQSGEKALEWLWKHSPLLVLLHWELEGISGMDTLRILRQDSRTKALPVIAFSQKAEQGSILTAFNLEADDYISYPFQPEETLARMQAVLSRRRKDFYKEDDVLAKGKITVELARHRVSCNGQYLRLSPKEYELLTLLMRKEGRVLSRQYLLETIWGYSVGVTTRAVDMLISRLRKKLNGEGSQWIETVQTYGYRIPS